MLFLYAFGLFIFAVSVLNLLRITIFSILADYYDIKQQLKPERKSRYQPLISVIIPAHNERPVLERCLLSVYNSSYSRFEVIVVDDGSTDGTGRYGHYLRSKHHFPGLRVVRQKKNSGKAAAINYGIRRFARGTIVVAMDADCTLDREALSRGVNYFRDRRINAVASNVKVMDARKVLGVIQLLEYMLAYRLKKAHSILNMEYLAGCTSFFRKSTIVRVGYYDVDTIAEDFDFSLKLIRRFGNSIVYADDSICYTEGVQSVKDLYNQRFRWRFGSFQAFYKNRQMFFNRQERVRKLLTFVLLPWLLFCEALFLLEPLMMGSMLYYGLRYHYLWGFIYGFVLYGSLVAITVAADKYIDAKQRAKLIMLAPIAYPLFLIINYVGYLSLVKSIWRRKGIFNPQRTSGGGWVSPKRAATISKTGN